MYCNLNLDTFHIRQLHLDCDYKIEVIINSLGARQIQYTTRTYRHCVIIVTVYDWYVDHKKTALDNWSTGLTMKLSEKFCKVVQKERV